MNQKGVPMSGKYLNRGDAPFEQNVWSVLDRAVVEAARGILSGRKLLDIEGPYGLGLRTLPMQERTVRENQAAGSSISVSAPWPLAFLHAEFRIPVREIASFEDGNVPFNIRPAMEAAREVARMEDGLVFNGDADMKVDGLLNVPGGKTVAISGWESVGGAAETVIEAVTTLDRAGYPGPYTLALAPELYNRLLRRYQQGMMTELQHIQVMVTGGIYKSATIGSGGVLLAAGSQFASIVLGQDITAGFIGPEGSGYVFSVSESLFLKINVPEAICVLTA